MSQQPDCDWSDCPNRWTRRIYGAKVKPPGASREVEVGTVHLCQGHFEIASRLGHLTLDWERVLKAMEMRI